MIHSTGSTAARFANQKSDGWGWYICLTVAAVGGALVANYFNEREQRRMLASAWAEFENSRKFLEEDREEILKMRKSLADSKSVVPITVVGGPADL